ncbi:hypothetical protein [Rhodopseudomonas sp.]|uniref:hypothetical protein n=1 Tax=Rhodopseudomonas sp. TaxID=1078 RepID=UPI003B3B065F
MDDIIASAMLATSGPIDRTSLDDSFIDILARSIQRTAPAADELPISFHQPGFGMLNQQTPHHFSRIRR